VFKRKRKEERLMRRELDKLPQARRYLRSAQWGFDELLKKKLYGTPYVFYLFGILASLRAVQHALKDADSSLSDEHKRVIDKWWEVTPLSTPELNFIRTSRNLLLKKGSFESYAIYSEDGTGEGLNLQITRKSYKLIYRDDKGKRRDLKKSIRNAIRWCDSELTGMEAKLPARYADDEDN
jgi:hypothetical protein